MTLTNIFFGKKVVQKAYLNNALIYESKGWQTLPSTCTEVWTKSYEKKGNICAITKDEDDNIYIGAGNTVYKIDSEGNLNWKCAVQTGVDPYIITAIVVFPNYIYCVYYTQSALNLSSVSKIDTNGNLISNMDASNFLPTSAGNHISDMQRDNDYIYATTTNHIFKLNFNLAVIDNVTMPNGANCLTTNNGPYIFVGTNSYGMRVEKSDFKNSTILPGTGLSFNTTSISMDSIGNVYLGSNIQKTVVKYDVENCKTLTALPSISTFALCTDNQENCYMACYGISLKKYSSDGTLIWDNVPIPASNNSMKVITDNNGNIYVAYIDSNGMLAIKKFINLVKEN